MVTPLTLALLTLLSAFADTIDRVVAAVGEQLVTESDVTLEQELAQMDRGAGPFWDFDHAVPLQRLIDASVVRQLAGDVNLYAPSEDQITARLEAVRRSAGDREQWQGFLRRHGLDEEALRTMLRRRLVVERYLERNLALQAASRTESIQRCDAWLAEQRSRYRIRIIQPEKP